MAEVPRFDPVGLFTLREIRAFIRRSNARGGVAFFGLLYVLGSLFWGGMVVLAHLSGGTTVLTLWGSASGLGAWNYPGILIEAPWGVISLPFFATFAMLVVAVGVGYGMTVAFLLVVHLLRPRTPARGGTGGVGALAGLTPAMISLVTLGACCSTTAAATAGVGVVAWASGTTVSDLLLNNWYLGVFQIVVVWVALTAQEMLLVVYGGLFGAPALPRTVSATPGGRTASRGRFVFGGILRALLLASGVVWALTVLAEWTAVNPGTAGVGYWFQWLVQHELLAWFAIGAALFPAATYRFLHATRSRVGRVLSAALVVGALSLLLWVPPPLPSWGVDGLLNQVLGSLGAPASWGAIAPAAGTGAGLYGRWVFEYILLAGFALASAIAPDWVFGRLAPQPAEDTYHTGPGLAVSPLSGRATRPAETRTPAGVSARVP